MEWLKEAKKQVLHVRVANNAETIARYAKKIGNDTFDFVIMAKSDRGGFTHYSKLYKNYDLIATSKARYLNRTWEKYTGQSPMRNAIKKAAAHEMITVDEAFNLLKQVNE